MKSTVFYPQGVCSRKYEITLGDDNTIQSLNIEGGCNGNLKGIARLLIGKNAAEAAELLDGVTCGGKNTSCPDQIAKALREML